MLATIRGTTELFAIMKFGAGTRIGLAFAFPEGRTRTDAATEGARLVARHGLSLPNVERQLSTQGSRAGDRVATWHRMQWKLVTLI